MQNDVKQVDRDAAANAVKAYRDQKNGNWQERIRKGECDAGEMVQAFAAHRKVAEVKTAELSIATIDRQNDEIAALQAHVAELEAKQPKKSLVDEWGDFHRAQAKEPTQ